MKYRIPIAKSTFLRPYLSTGLPATSAPKMVPSSAVATVVSCWVVPEITAVSKPKNRPPSAAAQRVKTLAADQVRWAPNQSSTCR